MLTIIRSLVLCLVINTLITAQPEHHTPVKSFESLLQNRPALEAFNKEVIASNRPVIVKFFLDGCPPCRRMKPVFQALAQEFQAKALFIDLNVNNFEAIADKYNVQSAPTFVYFLNGKEVCRITGATTSAALKAKLQQILA